MRKPVNSGTVTINSGTLANNVSSSNGGAIATGSASVNNLTNATLRGTTLVDADLNWTNFSGADLDGAILSGARLGWADLSTVSLDTVDLTRAYYNSQTQWPEGFDPAAAGCIRQGDLA